jgi:hypothetical protein
VLLTSIRLAEEELEFRIQSPQEHDSWCLAARRLGKTLLSIGLVWKAFRVAAIALSEESRNEF